MDTELINRTNDIIAQTQDCGFDEIAMPRKDFALQHFVIGQHDTLPMQWQQCVLEMKAKRRSLRTSLIERVRLVRKLGQLKKGKPVDWDLDVELTEMGLEDLDNSILSATRELETLKAIFDEMPRFTHAEIQDAQAEYWQKRLFRQAENDLISSGRVSRGNLEALQQSNLIGAFDEHLKIKQERQCGLETRKPAQLEAG